MKKTRRPAKSQHQTAKQEPLFAGPKFSLESKRSAHGGELSLGKRKEARPFDRRQAMHVVLRSSQASGRFSMLHPKHCNRIKNLLDKVKTRYKVRVYRYANVGNHLHLLVKAPSKAAWQGFIRQFSGGIAMLVTGAKKSRALSRRKISRKSHSNRNSPTDQTRSLKINDTGIAGRARYEKPNASSFLKTNDAVRGFWDHLVYTRLVSWGREFNGVATYVLKNLWERVGIEFRKLQARGFKVMEISEDGFVLVAPDLPKLNRC